MSIFQLLQIELDDLFPKVLRELMISYVDPRDYIRSLLFEVEWIFVRGDSNYPGGIFFAHLLHQRKYSDCFWQPPESEAHFLVFYDKMVLDFFFTLREEEQLEWLNAGTYLEGEQSEIWKILKSNKNKEECQKKIVSSGLTSDLRARGPNLFDTSACFTFWKKMVKYFYQEVVNYLIQLNSQELICCVRRLFLTSSGILPRAIKDYMNELEHLVKRLR
jgi:hypothetical protein